MKQKPKAELRRQAWIQIGSFGIPREYYNAGEVLYYIDPSNGHESKDMPTAVTFTHKQTGAQITVGGIYADEETGEILQVGSNYGALEY